MKIMMKIIIIIIMKIKRVHQRMIILHQQHTKRHLLIGCHFLFKIVRLLTFSLPFSKKWSKRSLQIPRRPIFLHGSPATPPACITLVPYFPSWYKM